MSMLSDQCYRLRYIAEQIEYKLPESARAMRYAADTIWDLRNKSIDLQAENEKLVVKLNAEHIHRQNVEVENAKLRELVRDMVDYGEGAGSGMAEYFGDRIAELGVEVKL